MFSVDVLNNSVKVSERIVIVVQVVAVNYSTLSLKNKRQTLANAE